jgi:hypothetical protein
MATGINRLTIKQKYLRADGFPIKNVTEAITDVAIKGEI